MHKSVSICTESGLLATDYCPSYSVETRGIVLIPKGHPLYDYINTYGDTIRKYLGEFATLQSTSDIANHICQIHDAYTATQEPSELENIVTEASNLVYQAYQLVGSSPDLSNDTRRQITPPSVPYRHCSPSRQSTIRRCKAQSATCTASFKRQD